MLDYCVIKDGKNYCGTKKEILNFLCDWWFDTDGTLHYNFFGYEPITAYSYGADYTAAQARADAIEYIFDRIPDAAIYDRRI